MKKLFSKFGGVLSGVGKVPLTDILFILGLGALGYGLSLVRVWVAFSVIGLILLIVAFGLGRGEGR